MKNNYEERCITLGNYIAENNATVRDAAKQYSVSKSTVHIDVTKRLKYISPALAQRVNTVLQENKAELHIIGGNATKEKYLLLKKHWYF